MQETLPGMTNVWDVLQTTIPIIGPVFIAGLVSYFIAKESNKKEIIKIEKQYKNETLKLEKVHQHEIIKIEKQYSHNTSKHKLEIKINILQEAVNQIDSFLIESSPLISLWFNISMINENFCRNELEFKQQIYTMQNYNDIQNQYNNSLHFFVKGVAQLKMLNLKNATLTIINLEARIRSLNNSISNNKPFINSKEFQDFNIEYLQLKENFYTEVSEYFDKLN